MGVPRLQHTELEEWLDLGLPAEAQGGALYAADTARSTAIVDIGAPGRDVSRFAPPGVDGEFEQLMGARARRISVFGALRMTSGARATVLAQRDAWMMAAGMITFVDVDATEYSGCTLVDFRISPPVAIANAGEFTVPEGESLWRMDYQLVLDQLEV
jgi:hypothetical protein